MDREILVEQIQNVERELRRAFGPVSLLMLVSPDPQVDDEWNVIASARGFNRISRAEGIRELIDLLRRTLARRLWSGIKRVTVLRTDDPFVLAMASAFRNTRSVMDMQSCSVSGIEIPKGVLFTSRKVAA